MKVPLSVRTLPRIALQAWFTPPGLGARTMIRDAEAVQDLETVTVTLSDGLRLAGFEVGCGPTALALHGWGGRAAQMAPIARRLAADGFRVIAVDLPGHAGGVATDIKEYASAVHSLVGRFGMPEVLVGHSFAGLAARLTFRDVAPSNVILIAPLLTVSDALHAFEARARLMPWTRRGLRSGLKEWDPSIWHVIDQIGYDQLPGAQLMILHDPEDMDTSFGASAELAAIRPHTTIASIPGAGHSGILSDPEAVELVARAAGLSRLRAAG